MPPLSQLPMAPLAEVCQRPALVLFSRAQEEIEPVCRQLDALREAGFPFSLCACENFANVHDVKALAKRFEAPLACGATPEQAAEIIRRIELLIWASVSPNTTSLLVNGLTRTPPSEFLRRALKVRLPIIANAPPGWRQGPRFAALDDAQRAFLSDFAILENRGIQSVETAHLAMAAIKLLEPLKSGFDRKLPAAQPAQRREVVTLHDVEDLLKKGETTVRAGGSVFLTDLAREFVQTHSMTVNSES